MFGTWSSITVAVIAMESKMGLAHVSNSWSIITFISDKISGVPLLTLAPRLRTTRVAPDQRDAKPAEHLFASGFPIQFSAPPKL